MYIKQHMVNIGIPPEIVGSRLFESHTRWKHCISSKNSSNHYALNAGVRRRGTLKNRAFFLVGVF